MSESEFVAIDPELEDYWRSIILFGQNVACYKFALAKSLLEIAPTGKTIITLDELSEPYSRHVVEHIGICEAQNQLAPQPYPFLEGCKQFKKGQITYEQLLEITRREGFKVVLDKFHNVKGTLPVQFYKKERGKIIITDELFRLLETEQFQNLAPEVEARWRLVERAWELNISRNLISVDYDPDNQLLFTFSDRNRRTDVTSCRDALNGYQKGKCFYSFADISIGPMQVNLADVDHFLPHTLGKYGMKNLDGVWNLVLSSQNCNRAERGKFDRLPHIRYLERLHTRNEYLIKSNHPLKETLIWQTGVTEPARRKFLESMYHNAQSLLGCPGDKTWQSEFEYPATF